MRVLFTTNHAGAYGGGESYLMRFALALDKISDFYVGRNWNSFFIEKNGFGKQFKEFNGNFIPDVHITCNHNNPIKACSSKNFRIVFFPRGIKKIANDRDFKYIAICDYTKKYIKEFWGEDSHVITPCIDTSIIKPSKKKKQIVSIGHFFLEKNGQSKNQHLLIEAFKDERLKDFNLILIGNYRGDDEIYVNKCKELAKNNNRIQFIFNTDNETINTVLSESSHYWHANGYNREDVSETEHFGIVALEAWANSCIPIVHNSGGCKDIYGESWNTLEDLIQKTLLLNDCKSFDNRYSLETFNKNIENWWISQVLMGDL